MVLRPRVAALVALGLLLSAPSAFAQGEPGVTLDPGSPTAKEYALPIEQARRDAGGERESATQNTAARPVPSFGEGVRPEAGTDTASERGDGASTSLEAKPKSKAKVRSQPTVTPAERAQAQDRIARALTVASVSSGDSSEGSLVLLVGGSVVLVLGLALGYGLRRHRS